MKKFTKIVATISDRRCEVDFLVKLAQAGMNVVRINSAHLNAEGIAMIADHTRRASDDLALMLDTKGPEVRTTSNVNDEAIIFEAGDKVVIAGDPAKETSHTNIYVNYAGIANDVYPGARMLIDDGELSFKITDVDGSQISAVAENPGRLGSRKSVNLPGVRLHLPAVSERDKENISVACRLGFDFIAHSFVRTAADVQAVQEIIDNNNSNIKIISKIEDQEGVDNFDEILKESYGIMIARGDLGIEVAAERIPGIQVMMINKCIAAHKPVIVATQMLHSMIQHPRPTRAEVSDVANAVFQRADAVMLSGETASGNYPVEAVETMARIALETERSSRSRIDIPPLADAGVASFLSRQAVVSEQTVGTKAIVTDAYRGTSARYIASFRGSNPTIAICRNLQVKHWLALSYGVKTVYFPPTQGEGRHPVTALRSIVAEGIMNRNDRVAYLSGTDAGATSLEIDTIDNLCQ